MGCRKNLTRLTASERQAFVNAVLTLKSNGDYDKYVTMHQGAMGHGHGGPAFFPWHREYLIRFENELQAIDSSVNLPYWDWTVENLNPAGTESLIWRDDFMGSPGDPANGFAISGPFSGWNLTRRNFDIFQSPGGGGTIAARMASLDYSVFRGIEGPHGGAHVWVGGNVGNASIAPQDPVFWLIHTNVERLWAEWSTNHQGQAGWVEYAPTSGGPQGHNLNDTMWPWNGTTNPFGVQPWTVVPENRRPSDLLHHRDHDTWYDTIDPECRVRPPKSRIKEIKDNLPKELKERPKEFQPKELKERIKEFDPKELKERPKELQPKEFKEGPKELKDIREFERKPIREFDPKGIREAPGLPGGFIGPELRPDLTDAALNFEPDMLALREELEGRAGGLGGGLG